MVVPEREIPFPEPEDLGHLVALAKALSGNVTELVRPRKSRGRSSRGSVTHSQGERAGLYVRVSLDKRSHTSKGRPMAEEIVSPDTQEDRARSYAESQGWSVAMVEHDIDESAYRQHYSKREGLMKLLAAVQRGEISKIIVFKFNRLSRILREFSEICDKVEKAGGGVVSVSEQVDTSTPAGRLIRNILASFAQFQSEEISEQIYETWLTKVKRGERQPGKPPYGTQLVKGLLQPHPETHEHLLAIYETFRESRSVAAVVDYLSERRIKPYRTDRWSLTVVRRILTNPSYVGLNEFDGQLHEGNWKPLVPPDLWQDVQRIIKGRSTGERLDRLDAHLLRGRVICSGCGRAMWTQHATRWVDGKRGSDRFYWCADPKTLRNGCDMPALHAEELEQTVWSIVDALSQDPRGFERMVGDAVTDRIHSESNERRRAEVEREHDRVEGLIKQLFNLLHDGQITRDRFAVMSRDYEEQLKALRAERAQLRTTPVAAPMTAATIREVARAVRVAQSVPEKRSTLEDLGVSISVTWKAVHLSVGGMRFRLPGRLLGERWYFGAEYHRLDYQGPMFTDKQIKFVQRTYGWADKQRIAARLGKSYEALKKIAYRLREKGVEVGRRNRKP